MRIKLALLLLLFAVPLIAQNIVWIDSLSSGPNKIVTFTVKTINIQSFTAFQMDVNLPSELEYINDSAKLTERGSKNHIIASSVVNTNILRIISYTANVDTFINRRGSLFTFQCISKNEPGSYPLKVINPILSNSAQVNIVNSFYDGQFTLYAPKITLSQSALDFGRVPLKQNINIQLTISNIGNTALSISKLTSSSTEVYFTDSNSVIIQPNQSIVRTVRFSPAVKGVKYGYCVIISDDPQSISKRINFSAIGYTINELHLLNRSGRSGTTIQIPFEINNMESFTSFQFDLILPSIIKYLPGSAILTNRKSDHKISAEMINVNKLRVVAYTNTNSVFVSDTGKVVILSFELNGVGGNYPIGLENVVIANNLAENILSSSYNGYINIASSDIDCASSINMGEVSIKDTLKYNFVVNNYGNDTLKIASITSTDSYFWNDNTLPWQIIPGYNKTFRVLFHNKIKGSYNSRLIIRSNDPDEDPLWINISANSFAPNYLSVRDTSAFIDDTVTVKLDVDNAEPFVAFQCDLKFPDNLVLIEDSIELTNRKEDHSVNYSLIESNKLRIFAYSNSQKAFKASSGTICKIKFKAGNKTGTFPLQLSSSILSDTQSQNILKATKDGNIQINSRTICEQIKINLGWNMVSMPINAASMLASQVFPEATSSLFKYNNGYQIVADLTISNGYWVKYPLAKNIEVCGLKLNSNTISVKAGWNMIGIYNWEVLCNSITSFPAGIISSQFFEYSNGYVIPTKLLPGKGYWVKVTSDGTLILPFPNSTNQYLAKTKEANVEEGSINSYKSLITIRIVDAIDQSYELKLQNEIIDKDNFELPPIPPAGIFDVRWANECLVEQLTREAKDLVISSAQYPIKITADGTDLRIKDKFGGKFINSLVRKGETVTITNPAITVLEVRSLELPTTYELMQNYPNPFNPTTVIKYQLPEKNKVTIIIFDALGREVERLVDELKEAGNYQVEWNATKFSSGVYFYQIQADKFVKTKKLILIK